MNGWMDFDEILCDGQLYLGAKHRLSLNFPEGVLGRRTPNSPKSCFFTKYSVCAIFPYIKRTWIERGHSSEYERRGFKSVHRKTGTGESK